MGRRGWIQGGGAQEEARGALEVVVLAGARRSGLAGRTGDGAWLRAPWKARRGACAEWRRWRNREGEGIDRCMLG